MERRRESDPQPTAWKATSLLNTLDLYDPMGLREPLKCGEIQHTVRERYANGMQIRGPGFERNVAFQAVHIHIR
jgi:hypothetical protein